MNIVEVLKNMKIRLEDEYNVPVIVERVHTGEQNLQIRVYEQQSVIEMGFIITLEWRRIRLTSQPRFVITRDAVFKEWQKNLELNRESFESIEKHLEKLGCTLSFDCNHIESKACIISDDCQFFSVMCSSGFLEIQDAMSFNFDSFIGIVVDFWGLILSFLARNIYSVEEMPLEGMILSEDGGTRYERNPIYRRICLNHFGYSCQICGMNLEKKYGYEASGIIEVHHIVPVSQYNYPHAIDPIKDLIPVCPNCHAVLHRKNPPYLPEEVKKMIDKGC